MFITNSGGCRYASFQNMSLAQRTSLRGTIVVCWNTLASVRAIQIYFVNGRRDQEPAPAQHSRTDGECTDALIAEVETAPTSQHGFSLVELLIVIIIVGILAAIAIPVYAAQRDKAKEAAMKATSRYVARSPPGRPTPARAPTACVHQRHAPHRRADDVSNALEASRVAARHNGTVEPVSGKRPCSGPEHSVAPTAMLPGSPTQSGCRDRASRLAQRRSRHEAGPSSPAGTLLRA